LDGLVATAAQFQRGAPFPASASHGQPVKLGITTMEKLNRESSRRVAKSEIRHQVHCRSRHLMGAGNIVAAAAAWLLGCAVLVGALQPACAQFIQQGPKLVGTGVAGNIPSQGYSVAVSSDGNTAIVGGPNDNNDGQPTGVGAAWVFTRNNAAWAQQGPKLTGNDAVGFATQGVSVALSADGNTAAVGGDGDNNHGAVWVYTRSNGVWTQQGPKLVGGDLTAASQLGRSVALSADGNTLIAGAPVDANALGAAVVYVRSDGVWSQQGPKLVGTGVTTPNAEQAWSVALSGDGNTAAIGRHEDGDNGNIGSVWVFTRSNGAWTQQAMLVGTGSLGTPTQGYSVALSADGNTLAVGGPFDNTQSFAGAVWVFTRNSGTWTQQAKVVPTDFISSAEAGYSVALSADGNTILAGGPNDNGEIGAAWLFTRSNGVWTQQSKLVGAGAVGAANEGWSVALSGDGRTAIVGGWRDNSFTGAAWAFEATAAHDFNGDGKSDIAWRDGSGDIAFWMMNGVSLSSSGGIAGVPGTWSVVGQRDFDGDGKADLLWHDTSGDIAMWFMNGAAVASAASVGNIPANWSVVGVADFNGDGLGDLLWRDSAGDTAVWLMSGATIMSSAGLGNVPNTWTVVGTGDFDGDGKADILWRDNLGNTAIWFMNGTTVASTASLGNIPNWSVVGTGDFNGDGKSDIVWRDGGGNIAIWLMNGAAILTAAALADVPTTWSIAQTGD
jgi:FG-GAP-like repeat